MREAFAFLQVLRFFKNAKGNLKVKCFASVQECKPFHKLLSLEFTRCSYWFLFEMYLFYRPGLLKSGLRF